MKRKMKPQEAEIQRNKEKEAYKEMSSKVTTLTDKVSKIDIAELSAKMGELNELLLEVKSSLQQ